MHYRVEIDVMPLKELLDPQGKAVASGLKNIGIKECRDVRIGKHITLFIDGENEAEVRKLTDLACKKLLANPVIEYYEYTLHTEVNS